MNEMHHDTRQKPAPEPVDTSILPPVLGTFCEAIATCGKVPADLPLAVALVVLAIAAHRTYVMDTLADCLTSP